MLTGKALIPVKVLRSFENWKEGDMILIEDWKARELWELGIVEIIDEADKVIGEIDKVLEEERKTPQYRQFQKIYMRGRVLHILSGKIHPEGREET